LPVAVVTDEPDDAVDVSDSESEDESDSESDKYGL
jgi:hypothetical protein